MPIYVYENESGEQFEFVQLMREEPYTVHPETGEPIRKVITAPKIRGDTSFFANRQSINEQFGNDKKYMNRFAREYKKQTGMTLPVNAIYYASLAEKQFDASAVVTTAEGSGKLKKLIARRMDKVRSEAERPPVRLAEDIVKRKMQDYRREGDRSSNAELRQKVIEKHGAKAR